MKVTRGRIVHTWGPWSNGHMEQTGIVTHVYGEGDEAGVPVNLHLFIDMGGAVIVHQVPFYPTRAQAIAAMGVLSDGGNGSAQACWFPSREE